MKKLAFALGLCLTLPTLAATAPAASGDVPYTSGGIGSDEREALKAEAKQYNLRLNFAEQGGGHFLSDVQVVISTAAGKPVLSATSNGPWFFAKLVPGRYKIAVTSEGKEQTRTINVTKAKSSQLSFYWK